ncbi:MAG: DUF86 domain-containing protein [Clostridiales Family XIII bacterium]|jgi:uncharacterized protein with HEPN domain|nr:DUF86 domain-containing protein [Clostridiales Family XIII bacterium]
MQDKDALYLQAILAYCRDIQSTISRFGDSFEAFSADKDYFNSISMNIMQIGEMAGKLSDEFRRDHSVAAIPWPAIRGMRIWFARRYGAVDKEMVWKTAKDDIPKLAHFCTSMIEAQ